MKLAIQTPMIGTNRDRKVDNITKAAFWPVKSIIRRRMWPRATCPISCAMTEASSGAVTSPRALFARNPAVRNIRPSGEASPFTASISNTCTGMAGRSSADAMRAASAAISASFRGCDFSSSVFFVRQTEKRSIRKA
jgi:hypothetical protein